MRGPTFGRVLASAPVRAASALTCVQWSPSSERVLLAYGRRHPALAEAAEAAGAAGGAEEAREGGEGAEQLRLGALPEDPAARAAAAAVAAAEASLGSLLSARPIRLPPPRAHVVIEVVDARDPSSVVASVSSAEDEVNAAAFHPHAGGGIAYGTKEGRLRLLRTGWG